MGKIIFIIGGIRSGKSNYAIKTANENAKKENITYIATGIETDSEMKQRIKEHKKNRPKSWNLIEERLDLLKAIQKTKTRFVIVDCINFWISNLLHKGFGRKKILRHAEEFISLIKSKNIFIILVSNEVGLGLVSSYKSGRIFQDILGSVNKIIAEYSSQIYFTISGQPLKLK